MTMKSTSWLKLFVSISGVIVLFPFIVQAQTPIDCGVNTAGSISVVGEQDNFTFTERTGDVVTIRVRKTSGTLVPYLELYDPSSNRIGKSLHTNRCNARSLRDIQDTGKGSEQYQDGRLCRLLAKNEQCLQYNGGFAMRSGDFRIYRYGFGSSALESLYVYGSRQ